VNRKSENGWLAVTPYNQALKALTVKSSFAVLLRTLYRIGLDYCVLPPEEKFKNIIVFTKEQLVSLIERGSPETAISDIPQRVAQGLFKPVAILKTNSPPNDFISDFISKGDFEDLERLRVLVIDDAGATVSSLKEALTPKGPSFPEWWEAPVPLALWEEETLHVNRTGVLMFGSDLKRLAGLPDKDEFLVTLEGKPNPCTVNFRRLEGNIFMLDDCTSDVAAAADIAWWAAVGKAWAATLDRKNLAYRRCTEEEAKVLRAEDENTVLLCEWEGEVLGYLCLEQKNAKKAAPKVSKKKPKKGKNPRSGFAGDRSGFARDKEEKEGAAEAERQSHNDAPPKSLPEAETSANALLTALGPQAMGFLAPGAGYDFGPEETAPAEPVPTGPAPRSSKEGGRKWTKKESKEKPDV
jgi:hypothetical protein